MKPLYAMLLVVMAGGLLFVEAREYNLEPAGGGNYVVSERVGCANCNDSTAPDDLVEKAYNEGSAVAVDSTKPEPIGFWRLKSAYQVTTKKAEKVSEKLVHYQKIVEVRKIRNGAMEMAIILLLLFAIPIAIWQFTTKNNLVFARMFKIIFWAFIGGDLAYASLFLMHRTLPFADGIGAWTVWAAVAGGFVLGGLLRAFWPSPKTGAEAQEKRAGMLSQGYVMIGSVIFLFGYFTDGLKAIFPLLLIALAVFALARLIIWLICLIRDRKKPRTEKPAKTTLI